MMPGEVMARRQESEAGGQHVLFLLRKVDCNDGIASYCHTLAAGLTSRGMQVSMICGEINVDANSRKKRQELEQALTHWWSIPRLRKVPRPGLFAEIASSVKSKNVSIINVHGLGMLMWGKLLSIATGVPLIATYHRGPSVQDDLDSAIASSPQPLTFMQRLFLLAFRPDRLIVLSEESKAIVEQQCPPVRSRIVKIYGGVDDDYFRPPTASERQAARARFKLVDNDVLCLHVGRMSWIKGQDLLIKAARQIRKRRPDIAIKCFFAGSGGAADAIQAVAFLDDEDRKSFAFFGYVAGVRDMMWAADMFVLPSRLEGFALVVAEAMSTGLVPIRTPSGGASDQIIDGCTGFIVPFENVDALSAAMLKLTDTATREAMSRECLKLARARFSRDALVARTTAVIDGLIA